MFTLQYGNSAAYLLANFPIGAEIQQLSTTSKIRWFSVKAICLRHKMNEKNAYVNPV